MRPDADRSLTVAQQSVLRRLTDGYVMDRCGRDGMSAVMFVGRSKPSFRVAAKTVSALLAEGLIEAANNDVTDYRITLAGRRVLSVPA